MISISYGFPLSSWHFFVHAYMPDKGVFDPEGCADTTRFFAEIAKRGMEVEEVEQRIRILK